MSKAPLAFSASDAVFAACWRPWSCASKAIKVKGRPIRMKRVKERLCLGKETDLLPWHRHQLAMLERWKSRPWRQGEQLESPQGTSRESHSSHEGNVMRHRHYKSWQSRRRRLRVLPSELRGRCRWLHRLPVAEGKMQPWLWLYKIKTISCKNMDNMERRRVIPTLDGGGIREAQMIPWSFSHWALAAVHGFCLIWNREEEQKG